jgi:ABC-type dipeptide/oligopeptide/nickel transport system ATPase component
VTTQAQILRLMTKLQREHEMAIVMITHDLGVVAELANDVLVMYGGRVVEQAQVDDLFAKPEMPYTWGLLGSLPRLDITARASSRSRASRPRLLTRRRAARSTRAAPTRSTAARGAARAAPAGVVGEGHASAAISR